MATSKKNYGVSEISPRGLEEITKGAGDIPVFSSDAGGRPIPSYGKVSSPVAVVDSSDFGGLTSLQSVRNAMAGELETFLETERINEKYDFLRSQGKISPEEKEKRDREIAGAMSERSAEAQALYASLMPVRKNGYDTNGVLKGLWRSVPDLVEGFETAAGNLVLTAKGLPDAVLRNGYEESFYSDMRVRVSHGGKEKEAVESALRSMQGMSDDAVYFARTDKMVDPLTGQPLTKEAKAIVNRYKDLVFRRQADDMRMAAKKNWQEMMSGTFAEAAAETPVGKLLFGDPNEWRGDFEYARPIMNMAGGVTFSVAQYATPFTAARALPFLANIASVIGSSSVFSMAFLQKYYDIRALALSEGEDLSRANKIGMLAGFVEASLELPGFKFLKKGLTSKRSIRNALLYYVVPESLQEAAQELGTNVVTEMTGLTDRQFEDVAADVMLAAIAGGIGAGVFGGAALHTQFEARAEALQSRYSTEMQNRMAMSKNADLAEVEEAALTQESIAAEAVKEEPKAIEPVAEPAKEEIKAEEPTAQEPQTSVEEARQEPIQEEPVVEKTPKEALEEWKQRDPEFFAELKRVYTEKAKKINKNLSNKQLENGWKAVERALADDALMGQATQELDALTNNMIAVVNAQDKRIKANAVEIEKTFDGLLEEGTIKKLNSPDIAERFQAQWDVVEDRIADTFMQIGSEKQGKAFAKMFRATMYNFSLFSPHSPLQLWLQAKPKILPIMRAYLNGQDLLGIDFIFDDIARHNNKNRARAKGSSVPSAEELESAKEEASRQLSELLRPDGDKQSVLQELYGADDATRPDSTSLKNALLTYAEAEKKVLEEMGVVQGQLDLTMEDYATMSLLKAKGYSQEQVFQMYGVVPTENNLTYKEALQRLYPMVSKEEMDEYQKLVADMANGEQVLKKTMNFFDPKTNLLSVGEDVKEGQVLHEATHSLLNTLIEVAAIADEYGIQVGSRKTADLLDVLRKRTKVNRKLLSPREFQETIADAVTRYVKSGGDTGDAELDAALSAAREELNNTLRHPQGSALEKLSKTANNKLNKAIANLFEKDIVDSISSRVNDIEAGLYTKSRGEILSDLAAFLNDYNIPNAEMYTVATEFFSKNPDMPMSALMDFAETLCTDARRYAFDRAMDSEFETITDEDGAPEIVRKEVPGARASDVDDTLYFLPDEEVRRIVRRAKIGPRHAPNLYELSKRRGKKMWDDFKDLTGSFVFSLSHELNKLSPKLGATLTRAEQNAQFRTQRYSALTCKMVDLINKQRDRIEDERLLDRFGMAYDYNFRRELANPSEKSRNNARAFVDTWFDEDLASEFLKSLEESFAVLDEAKAFFERHGSSEGLINNYWPMRVSDYDGYAKFKGYQSRSSLEKAMAKLDGSKNAPDKIASEISKIIFSKKNVTKKTTAFNNRHSKNITVEELEFYEDPIDSLHHYLEEYNRSQMMAELFNVSEDEDLNRGEVTGGSIGQALSSLMLDKEWLAVHSRESIDRVVSLLKDWAASSKDPNSFAKGLRDVNSILMLSNVINAINQTAETAMSLYRYGIGDVKLALSEVFGKKPGKIEVNEIGAPTEDESYSSWSESNLSRIKRTMGTLSFFTKIDKGQKELSLNSARHYYARVFSGGESNEAKVKDAEEALKGSFPDYTEAQLASVKQDIAAENLTDDVKFFLLGQFNRMYPNTATQIPTFLMKSGPVGKLAFQFMSPALKQVEFLIDDFKKGFEHGKLEGLRRLLSFIFFATLIGVPKEMVTSVLRFQKPDVKNAMEMSTLQYFLINEYTLSVAKSRGIGSALTETFSPTLSWVDALGKDVVTGFQHGYSTRYIPLVGTQAYNLAFAGREQNVRFKRAIDSIEIPTEDWGSSIESAFEFLGIE